MKRSIKDLLNKRSKAARRNHQRKSLRVESLETRQLMAADLGMNGDLVEQADDHQTVEVAADHRAREIQIATANQPVENSDDRSTTEQHAGEDESRPGRSAPFQNPMNQFDVDRNGQVTNNDALLVINRINSGGMGELPESRVCLTPYHDVNGDGRLTPADVLAVMNHLRQQSAEASPASTQSPHQNAENHLDVNNDGAVSAADTQLLTSELNENGPRRLNDPAPSFDGPYLDVNGDRRLSPVDVLLVNNYLNQQHVASHGQIAQSAADSAEPDDAPSIDHVLTETTDWRHELDDESEITKTTEFSS